MGGHDGARLRGRGRWIQERVAINLLGGGFLTEYYRLVAEWADWATGIVEQWPDDPGRALPDDAALRRVVRRGAWSEQS